MTREIERSERGKWFGFHYCVIVCVYVCSLEYMDLSDLIKTNYILSICQCGFVQFKCLLLYTVQKWMDSLRCYLFNNIKANWLFNFDEAMNVASLAKLKVNIKRTQPHPTKPLKRFIDFVAHTHFNVFFSRFSALYRNVDDRSHKPKTKKKKIYISQNHLHMCDGFINKS